MSENPAAESEIVAPTETDDNDPVASRSKRQAAVAVSKPKVSRPKVSKVSVETHADKHSERIEAARKVRRSSKAPAKPKADKVLKRTAGATAADVPPKGAGELSEDALRKQQDRIAKAKEVLAHTDQGNWELAKLSFDATEEDSPARMTKQDWANAIGLTPSVITRYVQVWERYGLPAARQTVGTGRAKKELSFNDHIELLKVRDPETSKELLQRMQAEGVSFATALKRHRSTNRPEPKSRSATDAIEGYLADLSTKVTNPDADVEASFAELARFAQRSVIALARTLGDMDPDAVTEQVRNLVRSVLNETQELETVFTKVVIGD